MRFLMLLVPAVLLVANARAADTKNFKESGSATAPLTLEVYTDFQCPHCREFYMAVLPSLTTEFINTGKVRLIHRDFRLPQFRNQQSENMTACFCGGRNECARSHTPSHQSQRLQLPHRTKDGHS